MKISNFGTQEMNHRAMIKLNGGQYFKPTIDGSWLANERSLLLKHARSKLSKEGPKLSFFAWLWSKLT